MKENNVFKGSRLSKFLKPFGLAHGQLEENVRFWFRYFTEKDEIHLLIREFGYFFPEAVFIQIGANDGMALDPLRAQILFKKWRGYMMEPVPYLFKRLKKLYEKNPRIVTINAAIADVDGQLPFYSIAESDSDDVWSWYHALGSFRREIILKHKNLIPDIEGRIQEIVVDCMRFETLCSKNSIDRIDLLQMDTEGYDFEIIKRIPFDRYRPTMIVYEHLHLGENDRGACINYLESFGYSILVSKFDVAALQLDKLEGKQKKLARFFE